MLKCKFNKYLCLVFSILLLTGVFLFSPTSTQPKLNASNLSATIAGEGDILAQTSSLDTDYTNYLASLADMPEVVVAVLDTGINTSHELFKDRILLDYGNALEKDINTSVFSSDIATTSTYTYSGYSFEDDHVGGHGTHVAGIICSNTPANVKILPVKIADKNGSTSLVRILAGLDYVNRCKTDYNLNIVCVNISICGYLETSNSIYSSANTLLATYFDTLKSNDITCVVASGNQGSNTENYFPAFCSTPIVVGSCEDSASNYEISYYSNYGSTVDVCAIGTDVTSATNSKTDSKCENKYSTGSGTSFSAPKIASAIANLCLNQQNYTNGNLSADCDALESQLYSYCVDYGDEGKDDYYGNGVFDFISYQASDLHTTYDNTAKNISITINEQTNYRIYYGVSPTSINLLDTTSSDFVNVTNGKKIIYYCILAENKIPTFNIGYLTIDKAIVAISVLDQTYAYGDTTIDQTKYSTTSSLPLGITLVSTATTKSPVGTYTITAKTNNANCELSNATATLTITPRKLTIALNSQSGIYGNNPQLNNSQYTITSGSVVNNDSLNITIFTNATSKSEVGEYSLHLAYQNANYDVTVTSNTYTIQKRPITITTQQSVAYGEAITFKPTVYTIVTNSIANNDSLDIVFSTTATQGNPIGEYDISITENNTNYDITLQSSNFQITKQKLVIKLKDQTTQHWFAHNLSQTQYSIISGSVYGLDDLKIRIYSNTTWKSNYGKYQINATYDNDNYDITFITATQHNVFSITDGVVLVAIIATIISTIFVVKHIIKKRREW